MSSAPHSYSMERKGNQLYSDRVFQPTDAARNKAQAEAVVCERCGKPVHPTNWMKHQQSDHSDDPKPLHDAHDRLPLAAIRTDGGTQPRASIDPMTVEDYAEQMNSGAAFPAITVFFDGQDYWLADGFHRLNAALLLNWLDLPAEVHQGTQRDAILFSAGVNATHGLRRTNSDKRRAVERLLRDEEWAKWSDREIAKRCMVSNRFVSNLRNSVTVNGSQLERTYTTKHGTTATMNTGNIGKGQPPVTRPPGTEPDKVTEQASRLFAPVTTPVTYTKVVDDYQPDVPEVVVEDEAQVEEPTDPVQFDIGDKVSTIMGRTGGMVWNTSDKMGVYVKFPGDNSFWTSADRLILVEPAPYKSAEATPAKPAATYAHHLTGSFEWYTPKQYVEAARTLMAGIDLDPASCEFANQIIKARQFYTLETDGMNNPWHGSVFLNPPYGLDENGDSIVETWVNRLVDEYESGNVREAVLLVNNTTERKWFKALWAFPICFTDHRICFYNGDGQQKQPTQGNAFVYFGKHPLTFAEAFRPFGTIVQRI